MSMHISNSCTPHSNHAVGGAFHCYYLPAFAKYAVPTPRVIALLYSAVAAPFYPELVKPPAPQHNGALTEQTLIIYTLFTIILLRMYNLEL